MAPNGFPIGCVVEIHRIEIIRQHDAVLRVALREAVKSSFHLVAAGRIHLFQVGLV